MQQVRGEVENTRLEAKNTKKSRPRQRTDFWKTDPLEAKDRMLEAKHQGQDAQAFYKHSLLANFRRNFRRSPKKRSSRKKSLILRKNSGEEKKVMSHDLSQILTSQKVVLSSTENRASLRTCRLQDLGLDLQGQGQGLKMCSLGKERS